MYENNNPHSDNENESSTYRYTPERGSQTEYTTGSQYTANSQSEYIPGTYSTVPPTPPEPPKKKKGLTAGKLAARRMSRRRRNAFARQKRKEPIPHDQHDRVCRRAADRNGEHRTH